MELIHSAGNDGFHNGDGRSQSCEGNGQEEQDAHGGANVLTEKTGKGFVDMNKLIKKWAEEDSKRPFVATVEFNEEKLEYTLKAYKAK